MTSKATAAERAARSLTRISVAAVTPVIVTWIESKDDEEVAIEAALHTIGRTRNVRRFLVLADEEYAELDAAKPRTSPTLAANFDFPIGKHGPISNDFTSVNINVAGDGVTYNQAHTLASATLPSTWPCDNGEGLHFIVPQGSWNLYSFGSINVMPRSLRVMADGDKFAWYTSQGNLGGQMIYIDGRPTALTPYATAAAGQYHTILFPSAKVRLIEIRTVAAISMVATQKPYTLWKPAPRKGPRVLVIGDSYTSSAGATQGINSIYWNIGPLLGSDDVWVDQQGGSGYGVTSHADGASGVQNRYLDRITRAISGQTWDVGTINPAMVVVHGGGANDKIKGRSDAQVIGDVTSMFTQLRNKCPDAKLVFTEGFAPPTGFSTFNPNYIAIRQGAQAALQDVGVYYIDVATTSPWIAGTGKVGATTGVGNSDVYISSDGAHPVDAGHLYIRRRMADKLRQVLVDDGTLLNTLI